MKKAVRLMIIGTVQGVFFRNFIKEQADKLNIRGFVRNLEDGNVEIVAEGNQQDIDTFRDLCRKGPKFANIRELKEEERKFSGEYKEFKVLRF